MPKSAKAPAKQEVDLYLKNNPDFAKQWFLKNVERQALEQWVNVLDKIGPQDLKPETRQSANRNSITSSMFHDMIHGKKKTASKRHIAKEELLAMTDKEMFMELIRDIANELDVDNLCFKILLNVSMLTKSDTGSLFLVKGPRDNRYLVSKLFNVNESSNLEQSLHTEENQIRVPFGVGIAGTVATTGHQINIKDAYKDSRFNKEVDKKTGYHTRSILCMPIFNYDGDVIGVAQIINKTEGGEVFTQEDEQVFKDYLTFCGIGLTNAQLFEMSVQEYKRNQMLLNLARGIFEEQANLDNLVKKIMVDAHELLESERYNVYVIDTSMDGEKDSFVKQHEAIKSIREESSSSSHCQFSTPKDVHFLKAFGLRGENGDFLTLSANDMQQAKSAQMAREVAASGEILNVADTASDPRFGKELADYDGLTIKNLLSLPIRSADHKIIGVVQLINKCNGKVFTDSDVNIVEAFAIFVGLGIHNCQMYENACKLMAKQSVALEVLSYHASASQEDTDTLKTEPLPSAAEVNLYAYEFNDFPLSEMETCKATLRMFVELDFVNKFHVPYETLCRWILSVKKNYRPVTYHNWRHAFNVAQTMFTMLTTGKMAKYMTDLEMFSLIVACLCHDLDHRGTNNTFQSKAESPLAQLYGTSTMEHHHFDQCIMILNSQGNNIFINLSAEDYRLVISMVEIAILSTDLALYFKKKGAFADLVKKGEKKWAKPDQREILRGMMMTACDVAAICKPWEIQREIAHLVSDEFFEQGDMERQKLGEEPIAMMDRKKKDELPKMQVGFINAICLPVYETLAEVETGLRPLLDGCLSNRDNWQNLADGNEQPGEEGNSNSNNAPQGQKTDKKANGVLEVRSGKRSSKTCVIV